MTCRLALAADVPAAAAALGWAFAEDPMIAWIVGGGGPDEVARLAARGFFAPAVRSGLRRGHTYVAVDEAGATVGAAVWSPPDVELFDAAAVDQLTVALAASAGPTALERLAILGAVVGGHHPHDRPHFYLLALGVTTRGAGVGGEVVAPVLGRCDADGLPAYLESSNPRNLGFYRRLGFTATWEERVGDDGPLLTGMWREPTGG